MRNKISVAGGNGLVECVNSLSFTVATRLMKSLKTRLDPRMACYFAIELIDPTALGGTHTPATWIDVDEICKKNDLKCTQVRSHILQMRHDSK